MSHTPQKTDNRKIVESYKEMYLAKYNLEGVDLDKELELIRQKKSSLSRRQRDAIVGFMQIFPVMEKKAEEQNEIENLPVGDPLTKEEADQAISDAQKESTEQVTVGETKNDIQ